MPTELWDRHLWEWLGPTHSLAISLLWLFAFAGLGFWYVRIKRLNHVWKERWEERHRDSIRSLGLTKQRTIRALTAVRWLMFAIFFVGLGVSFEPAISLMKGLHEHRTLLIDALIALNVMFLAGLIALILSVELAKYELRKIDQLLGDESTPGHTTRV